MTDKALEAIGRYNMIERGDDLVVGCSGGADSVALLYFLAAMRQESDIEVRAAHLNHNLRGEESLRDELFVRELCGRLEVELAVESLDIAGLARERGQSVEDCARDERYRFFRAAAGPDGKIATAHTLNDSAETQLLNLARGTGLRGLCGIPPVRDNIVRPLILCTRREIEAYCIEHGLSYVEDSTNATDAYTRNRLRHRVLPVLEEINPSYLEGAGRAMELLRREEEYLGGQAERAARRVRRDGVWDRLGFMELPDVIGDRLLVKLCRENGASAGYERVALLRKTAEAGHGEVQLGADLFFRAGADGFRLERRKSGVPPAAGIDPMRIDLEAVPEDGIILHAGGNFIHILLLRVGEFETIYKTDEKALKNVLDYDKISKIATLRNRLPGDRIKLAGRGCTKSLKKLFNEGRVPLEKRRGALVLEDQSGLAWVQGFGVGEGRQISARTERVAVIEIRER